jgi:hypothetical protein
MAERIKFAGDPQIMETGTGAEPQIPLSKTIPPVSVEMLPKDKAKTDKPEARRAPTPAPDDDDDDDLPDTAGPEYKRESIGARIGEGGPEATIALQEVEQTLDTEDVVPCLFPVKVSVQDKGLMHHFGPGVHLVPISLAGRTKKDMHWYLRAHKVRRTQRDPIPRPQLEPEDAT